ncbi:hypothetical protein TNCV_4608671 [Trichonephila clavipes]|nr:hypothetical protein TNCV_4608671 [Trichonephila clavipes]
MVTLEMLSKVYGESTVVLINLCGSRAYSCPKVQLSSLMVIGAGLLELQLNVQGCKIRARWGDLRPLQSLNVLRLEVFGLQLSLMFALRDSCYALADLFFLAGNLKVDNTFLEASKSLEQIACDRPASSFPSISLVASLRL